MVAGFVEEVRRGPPTSGWSAPALENPELELRRGGDEPIIGDATIALADDLTLLYTHRHFHKVAQAEARRAAEQERPFGVLLIELAEIDALNGARATPPATGRYKPWRKPPSAPWRVTADGLPLRRPPRLGLIIPGDDEEVATLLTSEVSADIDDGPKVRIVAATWRPGDTGDSVIDRARALLK